MTKITQLFSTNSVQIRSWSQIFGAFCSLDPIQNQQNS